MPDLPVALSAPGPAIDVGCGLVVLAAGAVAAARGRGVALLAAAALWLAGDVVERVAGSPVVTAAIAAGVVLAARGVLRLPAAVAVTAPLVLALASESGDALAAWWFDAAVVGTAVAVAVWPARAATSATGLVVDLASAPRALEAALARAVGDPGLSVVRGPVPTVVPGRAVRRIDDDAAVVHDPAALRDETLARSVDAALRLALATERLQEQVAARMAEVERSRRRLVEAGADERRRLGEQLHAGAERRLEAAAAVLGDDPARAEVDAAVEDLRRFAQGIHPRALTEHGLGAALAELGGIARLDVPDGRFEPALETVAYFVCSEAVANAGKHAPGAQVSVTVRPDEGGLRISIADDGPGGADPAGSGLRGLADRVEALGGLLRVDSGPGLGTTVEAAL